MHYSAGQANTCAGLHLEKTSKGGGGGGGGGGKSRVYTF